MAVEHMHRSGDSNPRVHAKAQRATRSTNLTVRLDSYPAAKHPAWVYAHAVATTRRCPWRPDRGARFTVISTSRPSRVKKCMRALGGEAGKLPAQEVRDLGLIDFQYVSGASLS